MNVTKMVSGFSWVSAFKLKLIKRGSAMQKIFPYLTYAGAIPFVFCALCLMIGVTQLPLLGPVEQVLSVYALVISTFLTGVHWGQHLHINEDRWGVILPMEIRRP